MYVYKYEYLCKCICIFSSSTKALQWNERELQYGQIYMTGFSQRIVQTFSDQTQHCHVSSLLSTHSIYFLSFTICRANKQTQSITICMPFGLTVCARVLFCGHIHSQVLLMHYGAMNIRGVTQLVRDVKWEYREKYKGNKKKIE